MVKCEVSFDGDNIYFDNKLIEFVMGRKRDYWLIEGGLKEFLTLEEAIKYCLEN